MFICASFTNALERHKKAGSVECWRDNVWEGTSKQVVIVLLETLCRHLAGRTEKNYAEISKDNVSGPSFETTPPEYKAEALIPVPINLRNLYSSLSFMLLSIPSFEIAIPRVP